MPGKIAPAGIAPPPESMLLTAPCLRTPARAATTMARLFQHLQSLCAHSPLVRKLHFRYPVF